MRARFVPVILLAAVAIGQVVLARGFDLTPWKGGGFGMFATLDHAAFRRIDIVVEAADRSEALEVPRSLEIEAARATAFPSRGMLTTLAARVPSARPARSRTRSSLPR